MKIGIVFTGIHYESGRDVRHCISNINSNLIEPFRRDHDVSIYLQTYRSDIDSELQSIFNPKSIGLEDYQNSHQVLTYIKSLEQIRNQDLDFVICTRFDIHFTRDMSQIGLQTDKFNALFKERGWWDSFRFTTDNFFAFPYSMLETFIDVLRGLYSNPSRVGQMDLHQAFARVQDIVGVNRTHIVSNVDELSNYNLFYSLCSSKWGRCDKF